MQLVHLKSFAGIELFVNVLERNEFFSNENCNFYYFPSPFMFGAIHQTLCLTFQTVQVFRVHLLRSVDTNKCLLKTFFILPSFTQS